MAKRKGAPKPKASARPRASRLLVYGLAATVFALPLFILPNSTTEYGYTKTILAIVLISLLAILWGIQSWRRGTWTLRIPWVTWPFLAFVAASLLSLLGATNGRFVVQSLVLVVFFFVLLVLIVNAVREKRDVTLLLGSFLASVSLVSLYGILQYIGAAQGANSEGTGVEQVISTLGNRDYVAGLIAYILFPATILILRLQSRVARLVALLLIAWNFGALMLFDQIGANVALIAGLLALVIGWLIFRPIAPLRKARGWLLALIAVCALAFLVEAPPGPLNSVVGLSADGTSGAKSLWERIGSLAKSLWEANSGPVRTWDWWVGFEMWKASPWVGVGLGNYKLDFLPYKAAFLSTPRGASYDFYIPRAAQAHNDYVQVLAEVGLLGLAALVGFLVVLGFSVLSRIRRNVDEEDRFDLLLLSAGLVVAAAHALVSFPAHLPASSLAVILTCGVALARTYGERATFACSLRGWKLRGAVVVVALASTLVSVVAVRDLASNIFMMRGIEQVKLSVPLGQTEEARAMLKRSLEKAEATLERSLRLDFAPHMTYLYLSDVQKRLGQVEAAFESLRLCQTRFVDEGVYFAYAEIAVNLGKMDVAEDSIDLLLATQPSETLQHHARYLQAVIAVEAGDLPKADLLLAQLVVDAPEFERARVARGDILAARGMKTEAIAEYRTARDLVGRKLAEAEKKRVSAIPVTMAERAEILSSIDTLRSEQVRINDCLKRLGAL